MPSHALDGTATGIRLIIQVKIENKRKHVNKFTIIAWNLLVSSMGRNNVPSPLGLPPIWEFHIGLHEYKPVHPRTGHGRPEGEKRCSSTLSLTSVLDVVGGHRHAPGALPWERPGTHCIEGWVDLRASLDECGKSRLHQDSIHLVFLQSENLI
jgi:hypothetical protein